MSDPNPESEAPAPDAAPGPRRSRRDLTTWVHVAQLVGALAVVLSLVYAATEFRRSRVLSSSQVEERLFERVAETNRLLIETPDLASIMARSRRSEALSSADTVRFLAYGHTWYDTWETAWDGYRDGILEPAAWQGWEAWFSGEARRLPRAAWEGNRVHFDGPFRDHVEAVLAGGIADRTSTGVAGVRLADLTWVEAERLLGPDAVVVLPLGAGAKEHGPHLRLDNDLVMADHLTGRVLAATDVVVAPTLPYHFYPAFLEYPGSTHLSFATARDVVVDVVRSLAGYGPRRFYVLNTGVSTMRPLGAAADTLAAEGILMVFTDIIGVAAEAEERVREQERGTHADEIETSMMLYIAPDRVDMTRAVREDSPRARGGLTRDPDGEGIYSASGVWGDATLATREKGRVVVEATVEGILREIEALRSAPLPTAGN